MDITLILELIKNIFDNFYNFDSHFGEFQFCSGFLAGSILILQAA